MPVHDMQRGARVAVVGAGVSGLTAARWLLAEGLTPVVFEQAATIGGLWNYREDTPDGGGLAYRSLRTNTSRQTMAFSDYPFPATLPDFPTRADVLAYLHGYAEAFGLAEHIHLRTTVDGVRPAPGGGWEVAAITPAGPT